MVIKMDNKANNKFYEWFKSFMKKNYKEVIFIMVMVFISFYKLPYIIYKPGGSINISERIEVDGNKADIGDYNMSYVAVSRGNIPSVLLSFIIKDWDLVKEEQITYSNMTYEESFKIEQIQLKNSLDIASLVAYQKAGKNVNITRQIGTIVLIDKNAKTDLEILDEVLEINGIKYGNFDELKNIIASLKIGDKVNIKVKNNAKEYDRYAYVYELDGRNIIGISLIDSVEYELTPEIKIATKASEAGPSGGLMLTLAIYDAITDGDLSCGKKIMGTGTMSMDGKVGAIGGVKYKMLGAEKDDADIFFIPRDNYEEAKRVYDEYKLSFDLAVVDNFDQAINYLNSII